MRLLGPVVAVLAVSTCTKPHDPPTVGAASSSSSAVPEPWEGHLGEVVTVEGVAEDAKLGALMLIGGPRTLWIDLDAWPKGVRGKRVRVTGKMIQRSDLPVFVQREGEPVMAGMPVPPGTDLEKARRRFVLTEAKWTLIEPAR